MFFHKGNLFEHQNIHEIQIDIIPIHNKIKFQSFE